MHRYTSASVYITGKRCDAKVSRTVWREADGKGLHQEYLAGGPPYLISSGGTAHSPLPRLGGGAIASVLYGFCSTYPSCDGRCAASTFKGMNGAPTSRSDVQHHRNAGWPTGRECAPCRALSYPRRSREKLRELFLGQRLTRRRKTNGTTACRESGDQPKTPRTMRRKTRVIR
jgi:hypothetical protein